MASLGLNLVGVSRDTLLIGFFESTKNMASVKVLLVNPKYSGFNSPWTKGSFHVFTEQF